MTAYRSGFCVLAGRPNVGKSTLLNALVGDKVAIVSARPQTTRNRITGVRHGPDHQIVFLDTPGLHRPRHRLGERMVRIASSAVRDVDVIALVVDGSVPVGPGDQAVADLCRSRADKVILCLNKVDLIRPQQLIERARQYGEMGWEPLPLSAARGFGVGELADRILARLPEGPPYYPPDMVTDQPERQLVAELVREQVLALLRDEVPHAVGVMVEQFVERPNGMVYIAANVLVERDSQKAIVIGDGGKMLKAIGQKARRQMETLLGCRVYLELWVKVSRDWRNRPGVLRELGYERE